jgi:hypothetical protein
VFTKLERSEKVNIAGQQAKLEHKKSFIGGHFREKMAETTGWI